ncbi:hypothetical protein BDV25DRAFT_171251 [Aspergillus avenaceus]|uniref:Uncharacterized protein n=1 Tax=Aspergillus avenaceus TaxID=36643 RepID=A0A5N6TZZ0_ASPAV|nr:hypothetical protein BDV25DRAFT_171251 [Aspergillus avenaceus]
MDEKPNLPPRPAPDEDLKALHIKQDHDQNQIQIHDQDEPQIEAPPYTPQVLIQNQTDSHRSTLLPKPVVIPQTSYTLHGAIYRPFTRAYAPTLSKLGISRTDFLAFIDALNEVWLAHPYLQAVSQTSLLVSLVPLLEFQIASLGVLAAAEYGSVKVSQARTEAYMRLANESLFGPKGLRVQVLGTRAMLDQAGVHGEVLDLGGLDFGEFLGEFSGGEEKGGGGEEGKYDPQIRRMEAVKEFVAEIEVDEGVPGEGKENWLKRVSERQEKWLAEKQSGFLVGRREKAGRLVLEASEAEKELNGKIGEVEKLMQEARGRAEERLAGPLGESAQGRAIVQGDLEKDLKKLEKKMEKLAKEKEKRVTRKLAKSEKRLQKVEKKESDIAQKVMWVVVTDDKGTGFQNHLYDSD